MPRAAYDPLGQLQRETRVELDFGRALREAAAPRDKLGRIFVVKRSAATRRKRRRRRDHESEQQQQQQQQEEEEHRGDAVGAEGGAGSKGAVS